MIPAKVAAGSGKYCSLACFHASAGYRRQVRAALPGTIQQIGGKSRVDLDTVRDQLVRMQKRGECHVARMVEIPPADRGRGTPKFALYFEAGPGGDPDMPINPRAAATYMSHKAVLGAMPASQMEIVSRTGHSQGSVSRIITILHAAGQCHVTRWRRGKLGPVIAVYAAGAGEDRPCKIVPMTAAERCRRYLKRAERKGTLQAIRARWAEAARNKTKIKNGDPLINALFGRAPTKG